MCQKIIKEHPFSFFSFLFFFVVAKLKVHVPQYDPVRTLLCSEHFFATDYTKTSTRLLLKKQQYHQFFQVFPNTRRQQQRHKKELAEILQTFHQQKFKNIHKSKQENQNKKSTTPYSPGKECIKEKVKTFHQKLTRINSL